MGSLMSRPTPSDDNLDVCSNYSYKYPPQTGNYFANYFMMGGEKFEIQQPEAYLFGENIDLNFLGDCPGSFSYPFPETGEPSRPIRCVVNVRRESVKLVKVNNGEGKESYNIEFIFDTDVRCSITIYYFCTEEITNCGINYISKETSLTSDVYYYKRGVNQQFIQPNHFFDPSLFDEEDLVYNVEKNMFPIAIHCVALEPVDESHQSHTTILVVDHHVDGTYTLRALKQKLFIDGLCYLLQEIYGIENKNNETRKEINDDELDDGGLECVICMSEIRDTLILPCKHLCLCQACADSLRYQASCCPICRSPFRALLQIKTVQKSLIQRSNSNPSSSQGSEGIISGYSCVPLIEALNGPIFTRKFSVKEPLTELRDGSENGQSSSKKRSSSERHGKSTKSKGNGKDTRGDKPIEQVATNSSNKLSADNADDDKLNDDDMAMKLQQQPKDAVLFINEVTNVEQETVDEDSEIEKLSPLLETVVSIDTSDLHKITLIGPIQDEALLLDTVSGGGGGDDAIDRNLSMLTCENYEMADSSYCINNVVNETNASSTSGCQNVQQTNGSCGSKNASPHNRADGMSPRTADDSDYYTPEESSTSMLTSLHADKDRNSLPGTPASLASLRSSADSYTSTCSSRMLLASSHDKSTPV